MGLDAYFVKVDGFRCPHCGDMIFNTENAEEIAYYRKNWELQKFLNEIDIPYGDDEYDKNVEIPADCMPLIIDFLCNQCEKEGVSSTYDPKISSLKSVFYDVQSGKSKLYYNANW